MSSGIWGELSSVTELAALGQLLEEHRSRLLGMLRRRIDPALAARIDPEEILHETFLQAGRRWPDYRRQHKATPYAWLYRIALDCLIDAWRRQTRDRRDLRRELPWPERSSEQLGLGLAGTDTSPSEAAVRDELRVRVRAVMAALSPQDQEILWLRHSDQLSFAEAGMVLGITENAATVRYARALRRLREKWLQSDRDENA
jgi:RNA polymerase sigma-70 factor, ECF subfamily